jgi:hypothetical protein
MNPIDNPLHLTTHGDSKITFSKTLQLYNYVCAVTEIKGDFELTFPEQYDDEWFLCCDFVHESIVDSGTLPVLHRIPCKKKGNSNRATERVNIDFPTNLWVGCNRNEVIEARLYITNKFGEVPSFEHCSLRCSLICIPRKYL